MIDWMKYTTTTTTTFISEIKKPLKQHQIIFPWQKGCGYHLDLFWVGVLMAVCSFMGLPWYVAATVISIAHIDSLKMESESSAPGEQPQFLGVRLVVNKILKNTVIKRQLCLDTLRLIPEKSHSGRHSLRSPLKSKFLNREALWN